MDDNHYEMTEQTKYLNKTGQSFGYDWYHYFNLCLLSFELSCVHLF